MDEKQPKRAQLSTSICIDHVEYHVIQNMPYVNLRMD